MIDTITKPKSDEISPISPNLTRLGWNQPLVESFRFALIESRIDPAYPVKAKTGDAVNDIELKSIARSRDGIRAIEAERSLKYDLVSYAPVAESKIDPDPDIFLLMTRCVEKFRERIKDRNRAGAILAVALTELGWSVRLVVQTLNASRPTINKWVSTHSDKLTDTEIAALNESFIAEGGFTYLFDLRLLIDRNKTSGLVFRKAVFVPSPELLMFTKALWRIAYRTRGVKSPYQEKVCAATLDIIIELLLRRGMTALNLAKMLGIQHMAVLQRNRKAKDYYGHVFELMSVEDTYGGYFSQSLESLQEDITRRAPAMNKLARALHYTVVTEHTHVAGDLQRAFLLRVRTREDNETSKSFPTPNVSILCDKASKDTEAELKNLDNVPVYAYMDLMNSIKRPYSISLPTFSQRKINDLALTGWSPLNDASLAVAMMDGLKYHLPGSSTPLNWDTGVLLSEYMLLQATGTYDRNRHGHGFGPDNTTYHWIPRHVLDTVIDIVPEDYASESIEALAKIGEDGERINLTKLEVDSIMRFFPKAHQDLIEEWLTECTRRMTELDKDTSGKSLLWKCLYTPSDILDTYDPPVRHLRVVRDGDTE